jgi:hypothetical protein
MIANRQTIRNRLRSLLHGSVDEQDFMSWLREIERGTVKIPSYDAALVAAVINLFEDDSIGPDIRLEFATDYLACLETNLGNDDVADILPLVLSRHRLCALGHKWRSGLVGRADFSGYIRNSRLLPRQKQWFVKAAPETVSYLCQLLFSGDFAEALRLLRNDAVQGPASG